MAKELDCDGIELVDPKHWQKLKDNNPECSLSKSHPFTKRMNHPNFHDSNINKLKERIDLCKKFNFPSVITFVGYRQYVFRWWKNPLKEGIKNCIKAYEKNPSLCRKARHFITNGTLNSRVSEKMKGHPGFAGDTVEYCEKYPPLSVRKLQTSF